MAYIRLILVNGRSAERARFYQGDEMSFAMNTEQILQGFEYHAYVYQNEDGRDAVYLYNYGKSSTYQRFPNYGIMMAKYAPSIPY